MILRLAVPEDAPALVEIYRPYVEETSISFETETPTVAEFARRMQAYSGFPYLVAEECGTILGYAYAHAFHERAAYAYTVELSVYVRRDCRSVGVGSRLYRPLLRLLRAMGVQTAVAVVTLPNPASLGFHHAFGFQSAGTLERTGYKFGEWRSVAYLTLPLGAFPDTPEPLIPVGELPEVVVREILSDDRGKS